MELVKKIEALLQETLRDPSGKPPHIHLEDNDGIVGWVASGRFRGMEFIDRINVIWDALEQNLGKEERRRVLTIVAMSPEEEIAHGARSQSTKRRTSKRVPRSR